MGLNDYLTVKTENKRINEQKGYSFIKAALLIFLIFVISFVQFGIFKIKGIMNGKA